MTTKRATNPKPIRYVYHLTYAAKQDAFVCKVDGAIVLSGTFRDGMIEAMRRILCDAWLYFGQRSELIIHRKDGTIGKGSSSRRTYGGDPKRSKG